tara:strand:+ start:4644 stop:4865 length:222 start_codon:yes stop_codon:yes gene_type:complete
MKTTKQIILEIGSAKLSKHLGVLPTAVSNAAVSNVFPSSWYAVIQDLSKSKGITADKKLFNFKGAGKKLQHEK